MHKEGIMVLEILDSMCTNFEVDEGGREKVFSEFQKYLPEQDPKELGEMLKKVYGFTKDVDTMNLDIDTAIKVIKKLYYEIVKGVKGTPLSDKRSGWARGIGWVFLKRGLKRPELRPQIAVGIFKIKKILEGYVSSSG